MGLTDDLKGRAEDLGSKAGDAIDTAKDRASDALDVARDKAEHAWDVVTDKTEEVIDVVRDKAGGLAAGVVQRFESGADPSSDETPLVEDFAAAGPVPEDTESVSPVDRATVIDDAAAETLRHSQPGQL